MTTRKKTLGAVVATAIVLTVAATALASYTMPNASILCTDFAGQIDTIFASKEAANIGVNQTSGARGQVLITTVRSGTIVDGTQSVALSSQVNDGTITAVSGEGSGQYAKVSIAYVPSSHGGAIVQTSKTSHGVKPGGGNQTAPDAHVQVTTCSYYRKSGTTKWVTDRHANADIPADRPVGFSVLTSPTPPIYTDKADWAFLTIVRGDSSTTNGGLTGFKSITAKNIQTF